MLLLVVGECRCDTLVSDHHDDGAQQFVALYSVHSLNYRACAAILGGTALACLKHSIIVWGRLVVAVSGT